MCIRPLDIEPVEHPRDQNGGHDDDKNSLPDRWCFGLSHPFIQRLIFLAGEHERDVDAP
jgi:hypothetical protein